MDKSALLALATRCEAASGPDRELDGDIVMAVLGWTLEKRKGDAKPYWRKAGTKEYYMRESGPPPYSSSLDAALSLAVEGHDWDVGTMRATFGATVTRPGMSFLSERGDEERYGHGATPALALTAAWLRARAALA